MEINQLRSMNTPNIIQIGAIIFLIFYYNKVPSILLPMLSGRSLPDILAERTGLPGAKVQQKS
jgi:hypothetical protein